MRWDGDQIAHTTGKNSIHRLKKYLLTLDPDYYYGISLSYPHIFLDPYHTTKALVGKEIWVHTYHKDVCFHTDKKHYFEVLWLPFFYLKTLFGKLESEYSAPAGR